MSKVKFCSVNKREKYEIIGIFFEIISNLRNKKEVVDFFIGLLTPSESLMMARRIQIANKILKEESYENIRRDLKVGFDTIKKTANWLNSEDEKYNLWMKGIIKDAIKKEKKSLNSSMLDKYAHHKFFKSIFS